MEQNYTSQGDIDEHTLEARDQELKKAWEALLKERREVEARAQRLSQQELQFNIKWEFLISETQKLAEDKKHFERRKKFFDMVQKADKEPYYEEDKSDSIVHGDMFFSGVSTKQALKKRYKDLIKIYHPDEESGDNETVQEINREYASLKQVL